MVSCNIKGILPGSIERRYKNSGYPPFTGRVSAVSDERIVFGKQGEEIAREHVRRLGYRILASNYKTKIGEIDIVAQDKDALVFIEVKTRSTDCLGVPAEAVTAFKQRQIAKVALGYLKENKMFDAKARFDVVSVNFSQRPPAVDLFKNAFELDARFTY